MDVLIISLGLAKPNPLTLNGAIARAKGCNVDLNRLGDGAYDGGLFNPEICDWDSGDCCLEVNTMGRM